MNTSQPYAFTIFTIMSMYICLWHMTKNLVVVSWSGQSDRLILISAKNLYTQSDTPTCFWLLDAKIEERFERPLKIYMCFGHNVISEFFTQYSLSPICGCCKCLDGCYPISKLQLCWMYSRLVQYCGSDVRTGLDCVGWSQNKRRPTSKYFIQKIR